MDDPITQLCLAVRDLVGAEIQHFQAKSYQPVAGPLEERIRRRTERYQQREARVLEIRRLMASALAVGSRTVPFQTVEQRLGDLLAAVTNLTYWERTVPRQEPGGGMAFLEPGKDEVFQPTETIDDIAERNLSRLIDAVHTRLPAVENLAIAVGDPHAHLGRSLEGILFAPAVDVSGTAGFKGKHHDRLLERLRRILAAMLPDSPRISILQSLHDRGCDELIEWPGRAKYGVQLKNNSDVKKGDFSATTVTQIQDSRQHGLVRLYVVLAADITDDSNLQKVRGFESRISAMNDPYVAVAAPERAWCLLYPAEPAEEPTS
jgi:hypothetical protein